LDLAFHHHVQDGALSQRRRGSDERVNSKKQDSGDQGFENAVPHFDLALLGFYALVAQLGPSLWPPSNPVAYFILE
jgi:hypothetical protein